MSKYLPTEAEWQAAVLTHLNRPNSKFRLYRQNSGRFRVVDRSGERWIAGAPEGAGDLVGIHRSTGRYTTIECKRWHDRTSRKRREKQQAWRDMINANNGIAIQSKPHPELTERENLMALEMALINAAHNLETDPQAQLSSAVAFYLA